MSSHQEMIQVCRVYTPPKIKKGTWILVDKLWPRGLKKEAIAFDLWLKDIAPSTPLRKWYHSNCEERWDAFTTQYIEELQHKVSLIEEIENMAKQSSVTLFYAAKDQQHNHALILQEFLRSWPNSPDMSARL